MKNKELKKKKTIGELNRIHIVQLELLEYDFVDSWIPTFYENIIQAFDFAISAQLRLKNLVKTAQTKPFLQRLTELQAATGVIFKNAEMDIRGKKVGYANLSSILKPIKPLFCEFRIYFSIYQHENQDVANSIKYVCEIYDTENESLKLTHYYQFPIAQNLDPIKAVGSTQTYAMRYILGCELQLVSEIDPDEIPVKCETKPAAAAVAKPEPPKPAAAKPLPELPAEKRRLMIDKMKAAVTVEELNATCGDIKKMEKAYAFNAKDFNELYAEVKKVIEPKK